MAHLESLGLPSDVYQRPLAEAEINGTPLSFEERMLAHKLRLRRIMAEQQRLIRLRNINRPLGNFKRLCKFERYVLAHLEAKSCVN